MTEIFKNKRIFVSGGAGVIGRSLVEFLYERGAKLFVGDLKEKPESWASDISYRQGDLNVMEPEELLDFSPEFYFHLAATFERSEEEKTFFEENYWHNIQLSHRLLSSIKKSKSLKRVVFASSYLIYDPKRYLFDKPRSSAVSLKESDPISPRNLCGMAKLLHERELEFIQKFSDFPFSLVLARIYRSYGKGSRDVISRWILALLRNEKISFYLKEGLFDFIFADDVAKGLISLAETPFSGVVNLGYGKSRKIAEVVEILKRHFPEGGFEEREDLIGAPLYEASEANMEQFERLTSKRPLCDLEKGISLLIEWYQRH